MNLVKLLFFRKTEEEEEQYVKAQKPKTTKKNIQPTAKSKKTEVTKRPSKETRLPWFQQARNYLREVIYELRKVVWPSRKETLGSTLVVLVIVIISGIYLGIVDLLLSRLIRLIIG